MANDGSKYCEDYLLRKEGRSKWIQYWVVIRGVWMLFYRDRATSNRDNFRGSIELTSNTKCSIARRGNYNFPFYVSTDRGTHLFKCETNLKRHQWMYLIDLAMKGDAPARAPLAVPSSCALTTEDLKPRDTQTNHRMEKDQLDSDSDEDDTSLPPGVILVTTPIEDLSRNENASDPTQYNALSRAVLTTGITGTTSVVRGPCPSQSPPKFSVKTSAPSLTSPSRSTKGALPSQRKSSPVGLNPHSAFSCGRSSPDRPSSSPSPNQSRKHSAQKWAPSSSSPNNTRFSRHMARSAPDIQMLPLDDPS
ncbi:hypothetical protein OS493_023024 [Desmophyllum pertusum]|uniref:PH domain-containing protein n=1 Tax=Desmophyllum pertusum TaxID=174260 RepID=A0A9W9ZE21_9CNID|nr:hypothetical protein OS493_023024 [Desmophyllum pertusum]